MKLVQKLFLFAIALTAVGFHPGHSIVGKWSTTAQGKPMTMNFAADSKLMATVETTQPLPMTVTISGTYSLDQDTLGLKFTDMSVKVADASKQALIDGVMSAQKQRALDQMNKSNAKGKLKWKSDDELSVTGTDGTVETMTRIKT